MRIRIHSPVLLSLFLVYLALHLWTFRHQHSTYGPSVIIPLGFFFGAYIKCVKQNFMSNYQNSFTVDLMNNVS